MTNTPNFIILINITSDRGIVITKKYSKTKANPSSYNSVSRAHRDADVKLGGSALAGVACGTRYGGGEAGDVVWGGRVGGDLDAGGRLVLADGQFFQDSLHV